MKFDTYLFDIDHTLYPYSQGIEDWFSSNVSVFVAKELSLSHEKALEVIGDYYNLFGSTLPGLMYFHDINPDEYYAAKGEAPLEHLSPCEKSITRIRELKSQKIAFTNASRRHGNRILEYLGLIDSFDAYFGIDDIGYWGKPHPRAYHELMKRMKFDPIKTVFFEDSLRNLHYPKKMGMTTVLIGEGYCKLGMKPDWVDIHTATLFEALEAVDAL